MAAKQFASQQTLEQAQSNRDQAVAGVQSAQAALDAAIANVDVLTRAAAGSRAPRAGAQDGAGQSRARSFLYRHPRADRRRASATAPCRSAITCRPASGWRASCRSTDVYIDANFKETQLARLKPGQPVSISVDALDGHDINGTVASVSPASGSVFSLLPPDNATGNFTKIVQRLAVRIRLPADVTDQRLLRPGMSVVVSVNTKPQAALADNAQLAAAAGGTRALAIRPVVR